MLTKKDRGLWGREWDEKTNGLLPHNMKGITNKKAESIEQKENYSGPNLMEYGSVPATYIQVFGDHD